MKKLLLFITILMPVFVFAQSVAINNDGSVPDNSALLDIKSKEKGLLMPRMTSAERIAIGSPALGLTVFDTNTYSYWVYRGALNNGWVELVHSQQNYWTPTGTHLYNNNLGNVGIGTNTPASKLTINGASPAIGFLNNGLATGSIKANGFNMEIATHPDNPVGDIVFQPKGIDRVWITESGKVGIGTSAPVSELTINGTDPYIQMQQSGVNKGYLFANDNNLSLGTSGGNLTGKLKFFTNGSNRMTIDEEGRVGIGTTSLTYPLTVNAEDPIVQLQNNGVGKGFLQVLGNDMKIGTNTSNSNGRFIARLAGRDRLYITSDGRTGLNTTPDDFYTFAVAEIDNSTPGIVLKYNNVNRASFSYNGDNAFLTSNYGNLYLYRQSNSPQIIYSDGSFSMGGPSKAAGYKLSVHGKVIGTEFTTLAINNWPDYVFAKDYKLRTLAEVKKFIAENHHLPGIPTAVEIEKDGVQLGDMSRRLIEKVEELTLYILQQQEQIDELKRKIK